MDAKEFLKAKGIHPTEPIYWDTTDKHGDRYIELHELMEEYASQTEMPSEDTFEQVLKEEFLVNTQNYPKEYHDLFMKKFRRAESKFKSLTKD